MLFRSSLMPWRLRTVRSPSAASPPGIGRAGVRWGVAFAPQPAALPINVVGWCSLCSWPRFRKVDIHLLDHVRPERGPRGLCSFIQLGNWPNLAQFVACLMVGPVVSGTERNYVADTPPERGRGTTTLPPRVSGT